MICTRQWFNYDWFISKDNWRIFDLKGFVDFLHYNTRINCLTGAIISETRTRYKIYNNNYMQSSTVLTYCMQHLALKLKKLFQTHKHKYRLVRYLQFKWSSKIGKIPFPQPVSEPLFDIAYIVRGPFLEFRIQLGEKIHMREECKTRPEGCAPDALGPDGLVEAGVDPHVSRSHLLLSKLLDLLQSQRFTEWKKTGSVKEVEGSGILAEYQSGSGPKIGSGSRFRVLVTKNW